MAANTIWIVCLEPIDQRYTAQWYVNIPESLQLWIQHNQLDLAVKTIDGVGVPATTTAGAFLDFAATNIYKASQVQRIAELFNTGVVRAGDRFLVTDAWNFAITAIKYMSELLAVPVEIHSIWHAGAYDPTDILGMKMSKPWPWHQEASWFLASDRNYFASQFHLDMFLRNLQIPSEHHHRAVRSGQPHEQIVDELTVHDQIRQPRVIWPHRRNADKQPEIALDLASDFSVYITQGQNLTKADYYRELKRSAVIFSCSLHENLGISVMEGTLAGAVPVVPDRCSYSEMYLEAFVYPSEWTSSWQNYQRYRPELVEFIRDRIDNREQYLPALELQQQILQHGFLSATIMIKSLLHLD